VDGGLAMTIAQVFSENSLANKINNTTIKLHCVHKESQTIKGLKSTIIQLNGSVCKKKVKQ
jgi:hypothetical protein